MLSLYKYTFSKTPYQLFSEASANETMLHQEKINHHHHELTSDPVAKINSAS
jgi:hypothetical protein